MQHTKFAEQSLSFQKSLFDSAFNATCAIQDQTGKITENYLNQMSWIPEEGKKGYNDAIDTYKRARDNFKKAVDEGFEKLESFFSGKEE